jgi:hypothetical protein
MVFNTNFNNISVILRKSVKFVEETGVHRENRSTQRKQEYTEETGVHRENRSTQRKQEYTEKTGVHRENRSTQRKPPTCRKSLTNFITECCIEYTSPLDGFELTTLVMIGTACIGSCKSNYHTITTPTATQSSWIFV